MTLTDEQIAQLRTTFTRRPTGNWSIGDALACISSLAAQFPDLLDEVTRARALLRKIEWGGLDIADDEHFSVCPACGEPEDSEGKHARAGCELAALIGK